MTDTKPNYSAILLDTSIFDANGLRLEKGLLSKLKQFAKSPVDFLMPDVIYGEVRAHLEQKIRAARSTLEKAINDAGDHIFFEGDELTKAKTLLLDSKRIEGLAEARLDAFLNETNAISIECGQFLNVSELLERYFAGMAPFSETGKKKNEFPDAIVLMAVEEWASKNEKFVLAIAQDDDWSRYCESSSKIDCITSLSDGLALFHQATVPYTFLSKLEEMLDAGTASTFVDAVGTQLENELDGFTPDQDAESYFFWEPEGSNGWFKSFGFITNKLEIIDSDDEYIVIKALASISVEAEGEFSLSVHDSIDGDYIAIDSITATAEKEFESEILITLVGDLDGPIEDLSVDAVEIINPIKTIHFGTLEPDFSDPD